MARDKINENVVNECRCMWICAWWFIRQRNGTSGRFWEDAKEAVKVPARDTELPLWARQGACQIQPTNCKSIKMCPGQQIVPVF